MVPVPDPDLLVLHTLRLKAFAEADVVADRVGLQVDEVVERLERFAEKGWVRHRTGAAAGWSQTPAGRVESARMLADELAATGVGAAVEAGYTSFLGHNQEFLQVCTDWQLRVPAGGTAPVPNDHRDAAHDHRVIGELRALDAPVRLICADLGHALARFGGYGDRFGKALRHVEVGDGDWFTRPVIDSYHTVWFELHEDLLATLGRQRAEERTP